MLTKLIVRNFKCLEDVEIDLASPVLFVGPNNSGKTSAMQALSLWSLGVKRWSEKRVGNGAPEKRSGVTINRRDLLSIPIPVANLLWRDLKVRRVIHGQKGQKTENVYIEILVEGFSNNKCWECGFEFYYANSESFYCRPLRQRNGEDQITTIVSELAASINIAFLPPMSGLAASELRLDQGAVNVRIGEGRTAEVLRNICSQVHETHHELWKKIVSRIETLFGAVIETPRYIEERGEIVMDYKERGTQLDLSSSGRGLQQTLLILSYMAANPDSLILLDEPDAHLEILRQRQIYREIIDFARHQRAQVIAASHSETLLNEAADKDLVVAFVGTPHRINGQSSQIRKALASIGFDQYYKAKMAGWVLYLEGSTDLEILQSLAARLQFDAAIKVLEMPFVHYVGNQPKKAEEHFFGLREAYPDLQGLAIFDHLDSELVENKVLPRLVWKKREIENYLCTQQTLEEFAKNDDEINQPGSLFEASETNKRISAMEEAIKEVSDAMATLQKASPWSDDSKVSDDFLTPLFEKYYEKLELPNLMAKNKFYQLAQFIPLEDIDDEVRQALQAIVDISQVSPE